MIDLTDCRLLGTITKTHGIHGEVILQLDQLSPDEIQKLESVFIEIDGLPVPFFISHYEMKNNKTLVLTFDDAESFVNDTIGCAVYTKNINIRHGNKHKLLDKSVIGYSIIDSALGPLGKVAEILDSEYNPLLRITYFEKEILLPLQTEFILTIDHSKKNIYVTVPDGLTNLS